MPGIKFITSGVSVTLQDNGRYGVQHLGISPSGAIDKRLMHTVNSLLGNCFNHPVLEFALIGPALQVIGNVKFCCAGKFNFNINKVDGRIQSGTVDKVYTAQNGDTITFELCKNHTYGYIGFAHNFLISPDFKSYSIDTRSSLGPNSGKVFQKDDIIDLGEIRFTNSQHYKSVDLDPTKVIKVTKGPQWNNFINREDFFNNSFSITTKRNRVGMYLKGPSIKNNMKHDMMSEGIVKGAIQITPNGETIVLLSDHGTTGGYPKIAVVCDEDYEKLAQMPVNHQFNFILE